MEVSIIKNFNKIAGNRDIVSICNAIKGAQFKTEIEQLRSLLNEGESRLYSQGKRSLLAFTPSGLFEGGRKLEYLRSYSQIIVLDIDKSDENTEKFKSIIKTCPYTFSCFISPSGKGLKVLVKVNTDREEHTNTFNKLKSYYQKLINFDIDPSGKDITRLCFFSYDPDIYINENSMVYGKVNDSYDKNEVEKLIEKINLSGIDITKGYDNWCKVGFALESEYGEGGRSYFHELSRLNPDYNSVNCDNQYNKCLKNRNSGISISTLFYLAKENGISLSGSRNYNENNTGNRKKQVKKGEKNRTTNKFTITEEYLRERYIIRYNVVSNKFEYKEKGVGEFKDLNENNLFIKLQKDNINISLNHLIALLKSDFVEEYDPFVDYFESLKKWDLKTDYISKLAGFLHTNDPKRLEKHFKKWIVRMIKTAIDGNYHNKQAFILVSNKQNSGKSTFCRFLCPKPLKDYIVENIGTDKDSQVAITENILINLDELSTADKNEINMFKSMFSKDKIKARLTYDKRASIHVRRASFIGSTDRWEFLTDENGSVRWLCFDIERIDWHYSKEINIDDVYSQGYYLLRSKDFEYELTAKEIAENDKINRKYQVSTPERDLIDRFFTPSNKEDGIFMTSTEIMEELARNSFIKVSSVVIGKELKFLGFERTHVYMEKNNKYGYWVKKNDI